MRLTEVSRLMFFKGNDFGYERFQKMLICQMSSQLKLIKGVNINIVNIELGRPKWPASRDQNETTIYVLDRLCLSEM